MSRKEKSLQSPRESLSLSIKMSVNVTGVLENSAKDLTKMLVIRRNLFHYDLFTISFA